MSRRDDLHFPVRRALEKEGWTVTHDPLKLVFQDIKLEADLGAERVFAAEKEGRKIAVEIKDFDATSVTNELEKRVGAGGARTESNAVSRGQQAGLQ